MSYTKYRLQQEEIKIYKKLEERIRTILIRGGNGQDLMLLFVTYLEKLDALRKEAKRKEVHYKVIRRPRV